MSIAIKRISRVTGCKHAWDIWIGTSTMNKTLFNTYNLHTKIGKYTSTDINNCVIYSLNNVPESNIRKILSYGSSSLHSRLCILTKKLYKSRGEL